MMPLTNDGAHQPMDDRRVPSDQPPGLQEHNHTYDNNSYAGPQTNEDRSPRSPRTGRGKPSSRTCRKCNEPLTGQFVRALGGTYHLDCFKCRDCGTGVASKFFPVDDEGGQGQYPLCETDYFRRLDLLCHACGGALRGSYITALDRKYHIEHFTCCVCPTVFGPQDSYYEHAGKVYCHYHYSTQFAQKCNGCQTAILKQFVEIFRNGQNQHWHPECYMIHKFWNVRLAPGEMSEHAENRPPLEEDVTPDRRSLVRDAEERMEDKVFRIWSVLSTFEESSAACISDMLLTVSNGAYVDGVFVTEKFIWHIEILFSCADRLNQELMMVSESGLAYGREAKLLCKKIVAFFTLVSKTQETGVRKLGVTQELLSLVTGLAHYLKLLIRISLQGALRLEREYNNRQALTYFLDELADLESTKDTKQSLESTAGLADNLADAQSDICFACGNTIEDECGKVDNRKWHLACISCSNCGRNLQNALKDAVWSDTQQRVFCQTCAAHTHDSQRGFEHVTKLQQYVFLLKVALARLLHMLRQSGSLPHTTNDINLATGYNNEDGHTANGLNPPLLRADTRSRSYAGEHADEYENTLSDIRRMRSTRLDQPLANSARKARQSRIIEGSDADNLASGMQDKSGGEISSHIMQRLSLGAGHTFRIVEDKDQNGESVKELTFGDDKTLTLDDIPRIVAAEQAREQRPNAYRHQRAEENSVSLSPHAPRLVNGNQRDIVGDAVGDPSPHPPRFKRYFSELSAIDYFIVRHLAVLSMQGLVESYFNLEELLSLIETRKATFWGKFGKAFKMNPPDAKNKKKKGVFGVPLDVIVDRDGADSSLGVGPGTLRVPALLDDALTTMRGLDMSVEGVFRKNGNIKRLKTLSDSIDKGTETVEMSGEGAVQVAALLKKYLRELPDPLLTFKLHRLFVTSQKIQDAEKRRRVLHYTCCLLPKVHRDSMEILFSFLSWVASFSHIDEESGSKMDVHNLATVITPNILYSKAKDNGVEDSFLAIEAVAMLIDYNEQMCEVPEDLISLMQDSSLFAESADMTTKDILKRYGEIANRRQGPDRPVGPYQHSSQTDSRTPVAPPITRVDTDPAQHHAWQTETSARHMSGSMPPTPYATYENGSDADMHQYGAPRIQYSDQPRLSSDSHYYSGDDRSAHRYEPSGASGQPYSSRNSQWGSRQASNPATMGIAGAS